VSRFHVDLHYMYSFKLFRLKVFAYSWIIRTFPPLVILLNFLETLKRMKAGQIREKSEGSSYPLSKE
jgi:hypothetical protein